MEEKKQIFGSDIDSLIVNQSSRDIFIRYLEDNMVPDSGTIPLVRLLRLLYSKESGWNYNSKLKRYFIEGKLPGDISEKLVLSFNSKTESLFVRSEYSIDILAYILNQRMRDPEVNLRNIDKNLKIYQRSIRSGLKFIGRKKYSFNKDNISKLEFYVRKESDLASNSGLISLSKLMHLFYPDNADSCYKDRKVSIITKALRSGRLSCLEDKVQNISNSSQEKYAVNIEHSKEVLEHIINCHSYKKSDLWHNLLENLDQYLASNSEVLPLQRYGWSMSKLKDYVRDNLYQDTKYITCTSLFRLLYPKGSQGHRSRTNNLKRRFLDGDLDRIQDKLSLIGPNNVLATPCFSAHEVIDFVLENSRNDMSLQFIQNLAGWSFSGSTSGDSSVFDNWNMCKFEEYLDKNRLHGTDLISCIDLFKLLYSEDSHGDRTRSSRLKKRYMKGNLGSLQDKILINDDILMVPITYAYDVLEHELFHSNRDYRKQIEKNLSDIRPILNSSFDLGKFLKDQFPILDKEENEYVLTQLQSRSLVQDRIMILHAAMKEYTNLSIENRNYVTRDEALRSLRMRLGLRRYNYSSRILDSFCTRIIGTKDFVKKTDLEYIISNSKDEQVSVPLIISPIRFGVLEARKFILSLNPNLTESMVDHITRVSEQKKRDSGFAFSYSEIIDAYVRMDARFFKKLRIMEQFPYQFRVVEKYIDSDRLYGHISEIDKGIPIEKKLTEDYLTNRLIGISYFQRVGSDIKFCRATFHRLKGLLKYPLSKIPGYNPQTYLIEGNEYTDIGGSLGLLGIGIGELMNYSNPFNIMYEEEDLFFNISELIDFNNRILRVRNFRYN